jgi:hypothetical protein
MRVIQVAAVLALALAGMSALSRCGKSTEPIADCSCAGCCRGVPTVRAPTAYAPEQATATDESSDSAPQSPQEKPETDSAKPPETATELDDILAHWESATSKIRRLHCDFSRFRYDRTFEVEKRGEGWITIDREGRARIELVGSPIPQGGAGRRNKDSVPYTLKAEEPETWHWTGPQLYRIDDKAETYEVIDVPANGRIPFFFSDIDLWQFFWAKPFLLGMPVAELKEQFTATIVGDKADDEVRLTLVPRRKEIAVWYEKAVLVLDRDKWLTKAVKLHDVTGSATVQVFKNVTVNAPPGVGPDSLSEPKLEGYKKVVSSPPARQPSE